MTDRVKLNIFIAGIFLLCITMGFAATKLGDDSKHHGPAGTVTEKLWEQAFWKDGVLVTPAQWCLEIDDDTETCMPEEKFNKYQTGDQYP